MFLPAVRIGRADSLRSEVSRVPETGDGEGPTSAVPPGHPLEPRGDRGVRTEPAGCNLSYTYYAIGTVGCWREEQNFRQADGRPDGRLPGAGRAVVDVPVGDFFSAAKRSPRFRWHPDFRTANSAGLQFLRAGDSVDLCRQVGRGGLYPRPPYASGRARFLVVVHFHPTEARFFRKCRASAE